uniref:Uncharacterized protein n=1 Tax=Noctiluca scintillans TaxID=2966 RepID=A0A7S0ZYN5_NOCSC|mmetsp:Transcript_24348/g.64004  ORF Transcript_24348/g.64004 Transcript_24348/m.64004 type:complete len:174 (+) Transcript_24348:38-559(+)|eukprot:CAMPEP_0194507534 /NCGR_PEP_ID=MMETSP0253-20130528/37119_1 /TAXON_ID=2966 /ORGANISM="Noctiluca scintillans" /LENGTH=173 /DNA_ID=CAMNT_0039350441 /DNA_START=1 /DNA_END=522 /DNA_ORIENTATION=-
MAGGAFFALCVTQFLSFPAASMTRSTSRAVLDLEVVHEVESMLEMNLQELRTLRRRDDRRATLIGHSGEVHSFASGPYMVVYDNMAPVQHLDINFRMNVNASNASNETNETNESNASNFTFYPEAEEEEDMFKKIVQFGGNVSTVLGIILWCIIFVVLIVGVVCVLQYACAEV